jgi:Flp pilus assembly protein TadB
VSAWDIFVAWFVWNVLAPVAWVVLLLLIVLAIAIPISIRQDRAIARQKRREQMK